MIDVAQEYKLTSVGVNPAKDRSYRMRVCFGTMTLRVLCIISLLWVRGPWIILVAIGAIVLPYVAVLIANAVSHEGGEAHEAPAPLELTSGDSSAAAAAEEPASSPTIIVVDAPAERRASSAGGSTGETAATDAGDPE